MRNNIERTAWIIISTGFGLFCSISILVPASIYWYLINSTNPLATELTSVRGIVLYGVSTAELTTSVLDGNTIELEEEQKVATNDTSQAILTFADDSSLTMYSNTEIILRRAQEPRFSFSYRPSQIQIEVLKGRVRATAARERRRLHFDLKTPQSDILLNQGSFSVEVNDKGSQVITRLGQGEVISGGEGVTLKQGERLVIDPQLNVSSPLPAAQNLLATSSFALDFENYWQVYTIDLSEEVTPTAEIVLFQDRHVLDLRSEGEDNIHTEIGVIQQVNRDVRDFQSLRVFAEVSLIHQSLAGGGQQGSEFPIMLNLTYIDANGSERNWFHGFYYQSPLDNYILYDQPDNSSEPVARYIWYPYESVNLLASLGPAKPVYIKSIKIYASGWIYEAMVANISLLAEE